MGVIIGGDSAKSGKQNHLSVVICVRILQNIGLLDLANHIRSKKVDGYKIRTKSVCDYWGMR